MEIGQGELVFASANDDRTNTALAANDVQNGALQIQKCILPNSIMSRLASPFVTRQLLAIDFQFTAKLTLNTLTCFPTSIVGGKWTENDESTNN